MNFNQTLTQPGVSSSEKSETSQPQPPQQPVFQGSPAAYPPSYSGQPVSLQAAYIQAQYPGQSVVTVQPAVYVTAAPGVKKLRDYLGFSIFTMMCCFLPLGIAALIFSCATRDAMFAGQREIAEKNSRTARILNFVALGIGIFSYTLLIIVVVVSSIRH